MEIILIFILAFIVLHQSSQINDLKWYLNNAQEASKRYFNMYLECSKDLQTFIKKEIDK